MDLISVDAEKAYQQLQHMIVTLELQPGALIDVQKLADNLQLSAAAIEEAVKRLVENHLVVVSRHQGLYVADIQQDLRLLSEMRVLLEGAAARLAAERANADQLLVLEALVEEQAKVPAGDNQAWIDIDHKLHNAIARAAANPYLERSLEYYFGLSQRLWHLLLPKLDFLSAAVEEHKSLIAALKAHQSDAAEKIMRGHVQDFYDKVQELLNEDAQSTE